MWIFLAVSLLLLPFKRTISACLLLLALCLAFFQNIITLKAVGFLVVVLLAVLMTRRWAKYPRAALAGELLLLLAAIALLIHQIPGFNNVNVLDRVVVGPHSAPFTLYLNADKALIPFLLFAALPTLFYRPRVAARPLWQWLLLMTSVPALLLLAVSVQGLSIEPHFPPWLGIFILSNLFLVALPEEALFRGYLQQRLALWFGDYGALTISAAVFGLAHSAGGMLMVIFAGLAGIIYGLSWLWTGRLWVATAFHFSLNVLHLLFFTYPFYQR